MKSLAFNATCPYCAGALTHIADGQPDPHTTRAIAECTGCGRRLAVQVTLTDASDVLGRTRPRTPRGAHASGCQCAGCVNTGKTHCKHGHELTPANTYVRPNGSRECRTCKRGHAAAARHEAAA